MKLLSSLLPIAAMAGIQYMSGGSAGVATTSALAQSFLNSQKDPRFQGSNKDVIRPTKLGQMNLGSRGSSQAVQLQPVQRLMQTDPRLDSAMMNLVQNARNQQVIDMFSKFANVTFTAKGGQTKTKMTEV